MLCKVLIALATIWQGAVAINDLTERVDIIKPLPWHRNGSMLDDIREVIRDEIKNIYVVVSDNSNESDTADIPELTEEQLAQNEADVLDVLDMF